jgi:hypothetical protein
MSSRVVLSEDAALSESRLLNCKDEKTADVYRWTDRWERKTVLIDYQSQ